MTEPEERTARGFFLAPRDADDDERTIVEPISGESSGPTYLVGDPSEHRVFSADMLDELRRRLREAEARESSGVRPLAAREPCSDALDAVIALAPELDVDVELDVEEPHTLDELEEVLSPLPELEASLAPHSESNFYAGFDEEHPTGVFVATYTSLPIGAPVYVTVLLPAGYRFRTPALVEWARPEASPGAPAGLGLSMCGLDLRMRRLIGSFARHRKPIFYVGA